MIFYEAKLHESSMQQKFLMGKLQDLQETSTMLVVDFIRALFHKWASGSMNVLLCLSHLIH